MTQLTVSEKYSFDLLLRLPVPICSDVQNVFLSKEET